MKFQHLNQNLNNNLNQQYLLHLKQQNNELRNLQLNCIEIYFEKTAHHETNMNTEIYNE